MIPPDPPPDDLDPLVRVSAKMGTLDRDYLHPCLQGILRYAVGEFEFEGSFREGYWPAGRFGPTIWSRDFLLTTDAYDHPSRASLDRFVTLLKQTRNSIERAQGRQVLGAYGAVTFDEGIVAYGEQLGLIVINLRNGQVEILDSPGFKPRTF